MGGMTSMASGMFVAWYLAEARKQMYKDAGIEDEYKQPVFVLISDLRNTEKTHYDGEYLVQKMVDLFNAKTEAKKLGLVKMLLGQVDQSYNFWQRWRIRRTRKRILIRMKRMTMYFRSMGPVRDRKIRRMI